MNQKPILRITGTESPPGLDEAYNDWYNDPHIEELYAYVRKILPTLKRVEELDLTDMEPWMPLPFHVETVSSS